jgi:hypothetical protein
LPAVAAARTDSPFRQSRDENVVNRLITISIKVNIDPVPMLYARNDRGFTMKKAGNKRGLLSWLFGAGWGASGSGG